MQRILLVFWLSSCVTAGFSQPLLLNDSGRLVVESNMTYLRDEGRQLALDDVLKTSFQNLNGVKAPNFGFDNAAYWFKIDITNQSHSPDWLLEINFSPLDKVDFYVQDNYGSWKHSAAGDMLPIMVRDVKNRHPVFPISIQPQSSRSIFLRIETSSSIQVPAILWQPEVFSRFSSHLQFFNGLFYGAMVLMTLYQLFLFFSLRERITLYYVITLMAMTNVVSFFQGYNFLYLHPHQPFLNDLFAIFSGPAFLFCSTLLTRDFLKLREFNRWLDYALLVNMVLDIAIGVAMLVFFRQISYKYHHYLILSHCVLALLSAGYCLRKHYKPARYYMVAWVAPFLAATFFTINSLGFAPGLLSMNYAGLMAGCILQTLFISFALGDRWNTLEKENQQAKELELKRGQEENERLEMEVQLRTAKILQQNLQLEEVNNVKDKLFSVVSHDIKGPLSSLHLALTLAKSGSLNAQEFQHISLQLDQRLGQTTEFIDNLLQWAKLQMKGETFDPDKVDLSKVAAESLNLLDQECKQKEIQLINNLRSPLQAFADLNMVRSILRNLLTNASKFTPVAGSITLSAYTVDNKIIISVADTGVGIPKSNVGRLFTLNSITTEGTKSEKGTGLGLLLCREFVEKNGGKIWFETAVGQGTTFYFSLPIYHEPAQRLSSGSAQRR